MAYMVEYSYGGITGVVEDVHDSDSHEVACQFADELERAADDGCG